MARVGAWPPVVAVTQSFDENVARTLLQMRVADFLVKPVPPVELVRTCARVARAPPAAPSRPRRRSTPSCPRSAAPASPRWRSRPRCSSSTAAAARQTVHLPGRSRFPARRLRRLSRPRAAPQSRGDRAAAGSARPPAARGHAVVSRLRPRRGRGAEPSGRDALVRSRRGDAAARSGVDQFRLRRVRHAAHLVLLDRQRAARLQQAVHGQRDDGAGPAPRQAAGRGHPRAAGRRAQARRSSSIGSSSACSRPACAAATSQQALGDAFAAAIPNDYALVREAIDRGVPLDEVKPGNKITAQLKKLVLRLPPPASRAAEAKPAAPIEETQAFAR